MSNNSTWHTETPTTSTPYFIRVVDTDRLQHLIPIHAIRRVSENIIRDVGACITIVTESDYNSTRGHALMPIYVMMSLDAFEKKMLEGK